MTLLMDRLFLRDAGVAGGSGTDCTELLLTATSATGGG